MDCNQARAEKLIEQIKASPRPEPGDLVNDLLREFQRGYPLDRLRPLLHSEIGDLVAIGAWIASELGDKGRPLLDDISSLFQHSDKRVRFWAIDCVLMWAEPANGAALASAIEMLNDSESAVRWKALDFLSRASREQLEGALSYLAKMLPKSTNVEGLRWLLGIDASSPPHVETALRSNDGLLRKYAVVAARRMSKDNREPLLYAASVDDFDVKDFAESSISLLG